MELSLGGGAPGLTQWGREWPTAERLVRVYTDTLEALPAVLKSGLEFEAWNPSDCPGAVTPIRSELTRVRACSGAGLRFGFPP